ncbi:C-mannosyltransferase dpy-19 homolog [Phlebotomus argentipes]|uniref:C-mannosyltransferase dpy-19 homolog n=1 Tax=Phlebotomus argentipes TaxID=94469 RepID=UPI0028931459|nr:C-mannosyltransferase dpy-19 homolog [Phlebotomus argentipes]
MAQTIDKRVQILVILSHTFIGMGLFFLQIYHVRTVFEVKTNFSHLSKLEREALFTSEHGLYYSFYKRLAEAKSFAGGLEKLIHDNLTEYPSTINSIHKFHIYPEILAAFLYKQYLNITAYMGGAGSSKTCWTSLRSHEMTPHMNCEGLEEPVHFYLEFIWWTAGLTVFFLYLFGTYMSNHVFSGIATVIYYFVLHENASRVAEFPLARENFAILFIVWQMFYLTMCIARLSVGCIYILMFLQIIKLALLTAAAHMCWQFSAAIFATQTIVIFVMVELEWLPQEFVLNYALAHVLANISCYYAMFGNRYFFLSINHSLIVALIFFLLFRNMERGEVQMSRPKRFLHDLCFFISITYFVSDITDRMSVSSRKDASEDINGHFINLFLTKFGLKLPNLVELLYLCNSSYAFLDTDTIVQYITVFAPKIVPVLLMLCAVKLCLGRRRNRRLEAEAIERAKNYVTEDFMEENLVTLQNLSNPKTTAELKSCLDLLEKCDYDYERYKIEKAKIKPKSEERNKFLWDVEKLKSEGKKASGEAKKSSGAKRKTPEEKTDPVQPPKPSTTQLETFCLYNLLQALFFLYFALAVAKLKFILTPFICLNAATLPPRRWFFDGTIRIYWALTLIPLLSSIVYPGLRNMQGQYSPANPDNYELEELLEWINHNTETNAVFAGPMDITPMVLVATKRPIVNHPHTEFQDMKERTRIVYGIYGKQQSVEIYNELAKLKVQYVILARKDCFLYTSNGCKMSEIWDYLIPEAKNNPRFCADLFQASVPNFLKAFINKKFLILQIFSTVQLELNRKKIII